MTAGTPLPRPLDPPTSSPDPDDLGRFPSPTEEGKNEEPPGEAPGKPGEAPGKPGEGPGELGDPYEGDYYDDAYQIRYGVRPTGHRRPKNWRSAVVVGAVGVTAGAVLLGGWLMSGSDDAEQAVPDERIRPTAALPTGGPMVTDEPDPSGSGHPAASGSPSDDESASASPSSSNKSAEPSEGSKGGTTAAGGSGPVLSSGQSGAEVLELQLRLKQASVYSPKADGYYDADVQSAVARYQRLHGITGDPAGVYGPNTRSVLESRTSEP